MEEAARNKATDNMSKLEQGQKSRLVWLLVLSLTIKANLFVPLERQHAKFLRKCGEGKKKNPMVRIFRSNINVLNDKSLFKMSVIVSLRANARGLNKIINVEPVIK